MKNKIDEEFNIPYYVFEAIVNYVEHSAKETYSRESWNEVVMLINMAQMNDRFSESQAKKLKEKFCREDKNKP